MGRHSKFTQEVGGQICLRIANGESLESICADDGMPHAPTVRGWIIDDVQGFAAVSARAYRLGHDALAEQCLKIADTPLEGTETTIKPDGGIEERRGDMIAHRKLQIDTRLRLLGKWSKKYGDKMTLAGDPDAPLASQGATPEVISALAQMTPDQLRALASKTLKDE